ncbi:hypothetical protein HORIV_08570 [Vreelandella olivaria]|uniref:Uncharacterized protein n=1 Tax=Vreelandella olivaria TaxID=390919 RepID=A0ABM7GD99_9GAMM|nr:hypothetical protein HORIV_08570 [Halomonas olivaria]
MIAFMAVVERVLECGQVALNQVNVPAIAVAGQNQRIAADAFATAVRALKRDATHPLSVIDV